MVSWITLTKFVEKSTSTTTEYSYLAVYTGIVAISSYLGVYLCKAGLFQKKKIDVATKKKKLVFRRYAIALCMIWFAIIGMVAVRAWGYHRDPTSGGNFAFAVLAIPFYGLFYLSLFLFYFLGVIKCIYAEKKQFVDFLFTLVLMVAGLFAFYFIEHHFKGF